MPRIGYIAVACILVVAVASTAYALGVIGAILPLTAAGGAIAVLVAAVGIGSMQPGLGFFGDAIVRASSGKPRVSLTFDDGPDPESTVRIASALDEVGARATFFVLVDRAEQHPDLLRRLAEHHEIGLHGLHHDASLTWRDPEAGAAELRDAARRLEVLVGRPMKWYRPPFGAVSPRLVEAVRRAGLTMVWCSVRTRDGLVASADDVLGRCRAAVAGDIVLLHEGQRPARDVLPRILAELSARGLSSVTVGELLSP
jgi:peptidoglycan/xylan/chitin deacetylase (PgdA/CDA1 family)